MKYFLFIRRLSDLAWFWIEVVGYWWVFLLNYGTGMTVDGIVKYVCNNSACKLCFHLKLWTTDKQRENTCLGKENFKIP